MKLYSHGEAGFCSIYMCTSLKGGEDAHSKINWERSTCWDHRLYNLHLMKKAIYQLWTDILQIFLKLRLPETPFNAPLCMTVILTWIIRKAWRFPYEWKWANYSEITRTSNSPILHISSLWKLPITQRTNQAWMIKKTICRTFYSIRMHILQNWPAMSMQQRYSMI